MLQISQDIGDDASGRSKLRRLSRSPYEPEDPRRSVFVDALIVADRAIGNRRCPTPHLCGGTPFEKANYEYNGGPAFAATMASHLRTQDLAEKDILDAGCGWGGKTVYMAERFGPRTITGFDLPGVFEPREALEFARSKGIENCTFTVGYAEEIPAPDGSFDVVVMEDVLEHVRDPLLVLRECYRVLRPGGKIAVKFPSYRMILAHHLDRAVRLPAAHYLLSMRTWAGGLNYRLLHAADDSLYEPFDGVVRTRFAKCVTGNLNGMDYRSFKSIVTQSGFRTCALELTRFAMISRRAVRLRGLYRLLYSLPFLREFLSTSIVFVGERPEQA